jgi:general secretion pathway protein D
MLTKGVTPNVTTSADGSPITNYKVNGQVGGQSFGLNSLITSGGGFDYGVISGSLQAFLYGIGTKSNVKVLSTPTITAEDNTPSLVTIGETIPYASSTTISNGTTSYGVTNENVAIALNVTPHVNEATDVVGLDVDQTVNEVLVPAAPPLNAPTLATREARTSVMVKDGQTIVIGGMFDNETDRTESNVPFLSKIPGLGELFKSHNNTTKKTELMVFLTPHILTDDQKIQATTDKIQKITNEITDPVQTKNKKDK